MWIPLTPCARVATAVFETLRERHNQEKMAMDRIMDKDTSPLSLAGGRVHEGTKRLRAWPMTKGDYNDYRGWGIPPDEVKEERGYLVEYMDGGKPNDQRHYGYISWSPADVFEGVYKPVLQPHQQRVVDEKNLLDTKREGLAMFLAGAGANVVPAAERERMSRQMMVMSEYSSILAERIAAF